MMVFSPLDEEKYDAIARKMTYWKIFELILEDFVSREDAKVMMKQSNLPVTVNAGQAVSAPPPSGAGTTTSPGTGRTQPVYTGDKESPGSVALKERHKRDLDSGGLQVEGFTAEIKTVGGI